MKISKTLKSLCIATTLIGGTSIAGAITLSLSSCSKKQSPTLVFTKTGGTDIMSEEGDYIEFNITVSNGELSDYTGSKLDILDNGNLADAGYINKGGNPNTDTGIFWNNPTDISEGVYVIIKLAKDYTEQAELSDFNPQIRVTLHDNSGAHDELKAIKIVNFHNANEQGGYDRDTDTEINDSTEGLLEEYSGTSLANLTLAQIVTYADAESPSTDTCPSFTDDWVEKNIDAAQIAALFLIEARNICKYVFTEDVLGSQWAQYSLIFDVDKIQRTNLAVGTTAAHKYDINIVQYVKKNGSNVNIESVGYPQYDVPSANFFAEDAKISRLVTGFNTLPSFPYINTSTHSSTNLAGETSEIITGNFNNLFIQPGGDRTDVALNGDSGLKKLFWPNVTFNN